MMARVGNKLGVLTSPFSSCLTLSRAKSSHNIPHDRFRTSLGMASRINQVKELRDYPDYSFVDGRATPITPGQLQNLERQRALIASAVQHLKEIKFIEERFSEKVEAKQSERQQIIDNKLKPKGDSLHSKKTL